MTRAAFYLTEKLGPKQSLTPEGFLLCADVPLARTGVMIYGPDETPVTAGPDGIVRIMREPSDVFTLETIASAQGKPVTNDHPDEDVSPQNWSTLSQGVMMNVRRGEGILSDLMIGDLLVTTTEAIDAVRSGKVEVSLGYDAEYEETGPGLGKQTGIIINHIALVDQGRCGPRCAIGDAKPTSLRSEKMKIKSNRILDALMKAFKAKDAAEVEELAKKVEDEFPEETKDEAGDTHIHIHGAGAQVEGAAKDEVDPDAKTDKVEDDGDEPKWQQNASEHADMSARISALEAAIAGLTPAAKAEDEEAMPTEAMDEFPDDMKEKAAKAKDSIYMADSFKDTVAMAEILVPGIRVPTFDSAQKPGTTFKKICGLRRQAMDLAYAQPATRGIVEDILNGKELDTKSMTCDAIRTLFRAAASAQRASNNSAGAKKVADKTQQSFKPMSTLADINRANAAKYANQ